MKNKTLVIYKASPDYGGFEITPDPGWETLEFIKLEDHNEIVKELKKELEFARKRENSFNKAIDIQINQHIKNNK